MLKIASALNGSSVSVGIELISQLIFFHFQKIKEEIEN